MEPTPERQPIWNRIGVGVILLFGLAVIVGFIWAIANAEAAVVTAAIALIIFAAGEFFTRRRVAQQYRWEKIGPTYDKLIEHMRKDPPMTRRQEERTVKLMGEVSDKLLLWGSPGVIKAWVEMLRYLDTDPDPKSTGPVLAYARILLAIRKDLGHGDLTLEARDLLRVVITDIDEHLPPGTRP
jgi:hypothetical protein